MFGFKYKNGFLINKGLKMLIDGCGLKIWSWKDKAQVIKEKKRCHDNQEKWIRMEKMCDTILAEEKEN